MVTISLGLQASSRSGIQASMTRDHSKRHWAWEPWQQPLHMLPWHMVIGNGLTQAVGGMSQR